MMRVRESYVSRHFRVVTVEGEGDKLYSIDYYARLRAKPRCDNSLSLRGVELCYTNLGGGCWAVVLVTSEGVELINLRLVARDGDPAEGDPVKALKICESRADSALGGLIEWRISPGGGGSG